MKTIYEKDLGGDGAVVGLYLENGMVVQKAAYPLIKILEPATKAVDSLIDKLEKAIPGDWDKPLLAKLKTEFHDEVTKLIEEQTA